MASKPEAIQQSPSQAKLLPQQAVSDNLPPTTDKPQTLAPTENHSTPKQQPSTPSGQASPVPANVQPLIASPPPAILPITDAHTPKVKPRQATESWNLNAPCVITAVLYKEAALDSPTFRASMNHMDAQLNYVDRWVDSFVKSLSKLSSEMDSLQEQANALISKFVPNFVIQGVIDHDYTMLAMRRYAEVSSYFWTSIIRKVKSHHLRIIDELSNFQKTELKKYKDTHKIFESAQTRYDAALSKYMGLSKTKEPSALREDAFQLAEARSSYSKSCFQLADSLSATQSKLDIVLVKSLTDPWVLSPSEFNHSDPVFQRVSVEMTRLKSWAKTMQKEYKPFLKQLSSSSKEIEQQAVQRHLPSRDLTEYTPAMASLTRFAPDSNPNRKPQDEKHGWVFVRSASKTRVTWVRRWIFVKNSMFGWLNIAPSKTFVQESDKVGVLLCHVTPISSEDRRFCFEIKTKDITFVVQTETRQELISWLQVFEDAKRAAVNSGESNINLAFQRIPPALSEFASTANASVDIELHEALDSPTTPQTDFGSRTLAGNHVAESLREIMTAGETLTREDGKKNKINFITIGPFGSSLVSSPVMNPPMPTSKSLDAILANTLLNTTTLPTAVTANYWGSINWIAYDAEIAQQESAGGTLIKKENKLGAVFVERYPDYYPLDLRSQDAQLRSLFQSIIGDNDNDRVVLAFRCLARPNPNYEVTCRVFVTPKHMCFYSHTAGFTVSAVTALEDLISVESHQAINYDTLYFIGKHGASGQCRIFLDSGRLVQKRMLFLIDNAHSEVPLSLKEVIAKLIEMGTEQHEDQLDQLLSLEKEPPATIDEIRYAQEVGQRYETQLRQFYDKEHNPTISSQGVPNFSNSDARSKSIMGANSTPDSSKIALAKSYGLLNDTEYADVIYSELHQAMSQLSMEHEFDIPAKALFHVMFGENSDLFFYKNSVLITRDDIIVTPWKLVGSARMEREIDYHIVSTVGFSGKLQDRVMNTQRVERMNDRAYIVYERRALWTLSQASFYTTSRYVILKTSKNACRLSIWNSIEWVRSSFIKNMTEPYILGKLKEEGKIIMDRAIQARQRLGAKGGTMTAIRMFGKLGTSWDENDLENRKLDKVEVRALNRAETLKTPQDFANNQVILSQKSVIGSLIEILFSIVSSFLGDICLVTRRVILTLWHGLLSNKVIVFALIVSLWLNIFYAGRFTKNYWDAKFSVNQAVDAIDKFQLMPTSDTLLKRSISLSYLDDLIREGTSFSQLSYQSAQYLKDNTSYGELNTTEIWTTPDLEDPSRTTLCYQRFRALALESADFDATFVSNTPPGLPRELHANLLGSSSELVSAVRNRIHGFRSRIGIARNQLIIEMRTINRLERELVMAEWQTWLFDEVSMCARLYDLYAASASRPGSTVKSAEDGTYENSSYRSTMLGDKPHSIRRALTYYCASCVAENKALDNFKLFEPRV